MYYRQSPMNVYNAVNIQSKHSSRRQQEFSQLQMIGTSHAIIGLVHS